MKYFLSFLALAFSYTSFGQLTLSANSSCTSYTLTATMVGLTPTATGINADDGWSGVIPIGFTFDFFGNNYTQCIIGSNGEVGFNTANAGAYNTWPIGATLASTAAGGGTDIKNLIAGPWCDICVTCATPSGSILYSTVGTAPNRKFEVTWCGTPMYSCTAQFTTTQVIIYEGTNVAEVHIGHKTVCGGWNGGYAECGVVNNNGSSCTMAPGPPVRDYPNTWTATNEAWRFTPNAPVSAYTVSSIPYAPIPYASSAIYWYDSATHAYISSGTSIVVAPVNTTTYEAAALGCGDTTKAFITVAGTGTGVFAGIPHISNITSTNPTLCGLCNGTIKLYGITPSQVDSVYETYNGVPQPPFASTTGTDSIMTFTGKCAGTYSYYVRVGPCPSNTVNTTLTQPAPIPASFTYTTHLGCDGDTVILTNTTSPSIYHSYWSFGDGTAIDSTDVSPTHIFFDNPGYIGSYTITLTYDPSYDPTCASTFTLPVNFNHAIDAHITSTMPDTSVCWLVPMTFTGSTISVDDPTYAWNFGDASGASITNPADYTYPFPGDYTVKFTVTDTIGCFRIDSEHVHVIQVTAHTATHDTSICLSDSLAMNAFVTIVPTASPYTVAWSPSNNIGSTTTFNTNFFGLGDYVYTVTVTTIYPICVASDTEAIHSYPPITLTNVTASQTIAWGSSIQLNADGAIYYTWVPNNGTLDNPNINNPIAVPIDSVTKYTVYGMSQYGCLDSASLTVSLGTMTQFVPSAFTPNGDGLNDVFRITNMTFQRLVDFRIFNRWGQQVFQTANREVGWDGTFNGVPQDMGVYSYQIIIGLVDGSNKTYKGTVTLIR